MKTQDRINQIHPVKVTCDSLWKVFGTNADKLKHDPELLSMTSSERSAKLQENGYIIGAEDISFSVHAGELFVIMGAFRFWQIHRIAMHCPAPETQFWSRHAG